MVQALIDETYSNFTSVVRTGREAAHEKNGNEGKALADDWDEIMRMAACLSGKQALAISASWTKWAILTTPWSARKRSPTSTTPI